MGKHIEMVLMQATAAVALSCGGYLARNGRLGSALQDGVSHAPMCQRDCRLPRSVLISFRLVPARPSLREMCV